MLTVYNPLKSLLRDLVQQCPEDLSDEAYATLINGLNRAFDAGVAATLRAEKPA